MEQTLKRLPQNEQNEEVDDEEELRVAFHDRLKLIRISVNSLLIENEQSYGKLLKEVEEAKTKTKKSWKDYRRFKRFDVVADGAEGEKRLISPVAEEDQDYKFYIHNGQIFDIIHEAHLGTGHGGKHKLEQYLKSRYANVTREVIKIYLDLCAECKKKRTSAAAALISTGNERRRRQQLQQQRQVVKRRCSSSSMMKSVKVKERLYRATVDIVDMSESADGDNKYILHYEDCSTKFCLLRPLKTIVAVEVAYNLLDIFCILGAPGLLQSAEDGGQLASDVIEELKMMWSSLSCVSHGGYNRNGNGDDIKDSVVSWMRETNSTKWSEGLRFCQLRRNISPECRQSPYEALIRRKPKRLYQEDSSIVDATRSMEHEEIVVEPDLPHFCSIQSSEIIPCCNCNRKPAKIRKK
ncbi:PREDICTED: KRAB-A domain-containing protein 2-like [Nicrophorus vespilloides]|uniref:KRAB-A domain-containing protein 2-like n=1 Tax=Nicrophorus vespilloides TaxID=110193 RepID=A0ABM1NA48_NICVS|nr:PREDICTED: KRAB-A domain-containing protein 2-like [Nicrophorus vespilloides]